MKVCAGIENFPVYFAEASRNVWNKINVRRKRCIVVSQSWLHCNAINISSFFAEASWKFKKKINLEKKTFYHSHGIKMQNDSFFFAKACKSMSEKTWKFKNKINVGRKPITVLTLQCNETIPPFFAEASWKVKIVILHKVILQRSFESKS